MGDRDRLWLRLTRSALTTTTISNRSNMLGKRDVLINSSEQDILVNPSKQDILVNPSEQDILINPSEQDILINPSEQDARTTRNSKPNIAITQPRKSLLHERGAFSRRVPLSASEKGF